MQIVVLRDKNALANPTLVTFLNQALAANGLIAPGGLADVAQDIFAYIERPDHFLILGIEDGAFVSLALAHLAMNRLFPYPMINYVYNVGSRAILRAVLDRLMDIFVSHGYTAVWAVNASGKPDRVWERVLDNGRNVFKRLGTVYSVGVK